MGTTMTREIFNTMFDKYADIIKKQSYHGFYTTCWNGNLKKLLGDDCKVTYCGYSVIEFSNGIFHYVAHDSYPNEGWHLETWVSAYIKNDITKGIHGVKLYRDKEWNDDTIFKTSFGCGLSYHTMDYTIKDVQFVDVAEDNHNAILTALKYGISIEDARKAVYGENNSK